ncbi:hypothetical protein A306_00000116 [Columba livia]|uniref:Alpha-2-macroglobulin-like protein 1 n=1 Tax=Columba livia TaxID=8932 RepID=A0A2I0LXU5_COLLI|nr:hypothetical protein A306_00000116 [Columba livia]
MRMKSIEFINLHPFYKRGLPYTGKVFCHSSESPLSNETVDVNDEETHLSFLTDKNGEVHFSLDTTSWNSTLVSLKATYKLGKDNEQNSSESYTGVEDSFHWLKPFYSESNSFLEIKARNDVMPCDQEQEVQVDYILDQNKLSSEADHINFYYLAIAKRKILFNREKRVPILQHENLQGSFSLTLTIGNDFLPDIKLLLYAVFLYGEVVADMEEFQVEECFRHKMSRNTRSVALDFSHEKVPGSKVSLDLKAALGSPCSVQAVDKSVLLNKDNTLIANTILRMKILTNTRIKKPVSCMKPGFEKKKYIGKYSVFENHVGHNDSVPHSDNTRKPRPRTLFPETWISDLVSVRDDGQASLQAAVPDTITEWNANTFCVADTGFGWSPLTTLKVFQPFFVDLSLPYSLIQGETFSLKATVFNCLKDCIQVRTTLTETPELKVDACPECQFTSCLCANEAKTFEWNVTATRLGKVNVTVSSVAEDSHNLFGNRIAVTPLQGERDTVIKPLLLKPGGVLQEKTHYAFCCAADNTVSEEFSLMLPAEVLEGSDRATFSVIGDIMGPALQNLDHLLMMPFGCGEQNMVQFAPNIFILQYVKKTKQLYPEIEEKALKFLRTGYQSQLLYKHDDGSYSAFGNLTTRAIHGPLDKPVLTFTSVRIMCTMLCSGCRSTSCPVAASVGAVDDTISLTAYITAALVELHLEKNDTMLNNALHCLKNVTLDKTSLYVKALMAYVFTLRKDMEMREQLLDMLEKETAELLTSHSSSEESSSSSSMIETAAYILLAYVSKPDLAYNDASMTKLVHWLSGQRNAFGGFASTQDTVVSLQALAQYAALISQEIRDVKVTVKSKEASPLVFHVHRNNKLVLHQAPLPAVPGMYTVQATGSGCVYVQTSLYYNIPPPETEEVFVLDVETVPREWDDVRKQLDIHVSISYTGSCEISNMALVEVEMLSGFIPVSSSVTAVRLFSLVSSEDKKISFPDVVQPEISKLK